MSHLTKCNKNSKLCDESFQLNCKLHTPSYSCRGLSIWQPQQSPAVQTSLHKSHTLGPDAPQKLLGRQPTFSDPYPENYPFSSIRQPFLQGIWSELFWPYTLHELVLARSIISNIYTPPLYCKFFIQLSSHHCTSQPGSFEPCITRLLHERIKHKCQPSTDLGR